VTDLLDGIDEVFPECRRRWMVALDHVLEGFFLVMPKNTAARKIELTSAIHPAAACASL
jgi:hypothetical protein